MYNFFLDKSLRDFKIVKCNIFFALSKKPKLNANYDINF